MRIRFFSYYNLILVMFLINSQNLYSAELIPFSLPWDDSTSTLTNVSHLLDKPAGKNGFVRTQEDHFVDGLGNRFRVLGVNTAFSGNFPTHQQAEKIAARMAKFGINCVRFHHMDTLRAPAGIWKEGTPEKQQLDPTNLDRLDYFIHELKKNGIYTNINLKVGRKTVAADGVPDANLLPTYDKGPDYFFPRLIELQKQYARDLLTHVNPYTGNAYTNEPAVAMIEINNESGLLQTLHSGNLDNLTQPYSEVLQTLWNTHLREKYPSTEALKSAWEPSTQIESKELLTSDLKGWRLQSLFNARANLSHTEEGPEEKAAIKVTTTEPADVDWHVQLLHPNISLQKGVFYRASIWMKSDKSQNVSVSLQMDYDPWTVLDSAATGQVDSNWKEYKFSFMPSENCPNARLNIGSFGTQTGFFWIADTRLISENRTGLNEGESLEKGNISWIKKSEFSSRSEIQQRDWIEFLVERETFYYSDLYNFIRGELGAESLIGGSQLGFTTILSQMETDFIDHHGYWQHPHFPGRAWDSQNWTVRNVSMVNNLRNTLYGLMVSQVKNYPYTVSEYNNPAPNTFSSEGIPLIAAFGALQDWDAIFFFAYSHSDQFDRKSINSFFDIAGHTPKMLSMPAAANLFLRGDIKPANEEVVVSMTRSEYIDFLTGTGGSPWARPFDAQNDPAFTTAAPYVHRTQVHLASEPIHQENPITNVRGRLESDTGELLWRYRTDDNSYVQIMSPLTKGLIGFTPDAELDLLHGVQIRIGETIQNWANVLLTFMQEDDEGSHWLLTATGYAENEGMVWKGDQKESVGNQWGAGPPLVEAIPLRLVWANQVASPKLYALDEHGARKVDLSNRVNLDNGRAEINLMNQPQHLWYEIVIGPQSSVENP